MWNLLILLSVTFGAFIILDAPARARRHAEERRLVLRALAVLGPDGTAAGIARHGGTPLFPDGVTRSHLAALEEDGLVVKSAGDRGGRRITRYQLLAGDPRGDTMQTSAARSTLTVYHDGGCPLCAAEIGHYKRARGARGLTFEDVGAGPPREADLTREAALARFHVRDGNGELVSGAAAFAALWKALPGWRWLGNLVGTWPILPLAELAYRAFLPLRPRLASMLVTVGVLKPVSNRLPR